jgi:hypothetical protein
MNCFTFYGDDYGKIDILPKFANLDREESANNEKAAFGCRLPKHRPPF